MGSPRQRSGSAIEVHVADDGGRHQPPLGQPVGAAVRRHELGRERARLLDEIEAEDAPADQRHRPLESQRQRVRNTHDMCIDRRTAWVNRRASVFAPPPRCRHRMPSHAIAAAP